MKKRKLIAVLLILFAFSVHSVFACTIFAVGKGATVDGSTMTSHSCDSNSDDFRVWLIPSMEAGTVRDIVLDGRAGGDFSQFPEVKNYGTRALVLGSETYEKPSNQYIHSMYSFINDKGLAMGESTCSFDDCTGKRSALRAAWNRDEGILDCYCLQDMTLENCSTAREAVEYMGAMIDKYGWNGAAECINICDGNEAWVFEAYGGKIWVAIRVPDDSIFVAANRCRINVFYEDDPENYLYAAGIKEYAIENDLWDGTGDFMPCEIFAPSRSKLCTLRVWRALSLLDSDLNLDPNENPNNWPLFVVPDHKVSVNDIWTIHQDYYQGTEFDASKDIWAGPFENVLQSLYNTRTINKDVSAYVQIANVKSWLPEEARCLVWFGWGAASTQYLTPVFASAKSLPSHFGEGIRQESYNEDSGWWVENRVQQTATINYKSAIEDIRAVRDPIMAKQYDVTSAVQNFAAKMIKEGNTEEAVDLLTMYTAQQSIMWNNTYDKLGDDLFAKYTLNRVNMRNPVASDWWSEHVQVL